MNQKQHTKTIEKVRASARPSHFTAHAHSAFLCLVQSLSPEFDEVLVFEYRNIYPNEIERGKVCLRVMDANTLRRDVLIG